MRVRSISDRDRRGGAAPTRRAVLGGFAAVPFAAVAAPGAGGRRFGWPDRLGWPDGLGLADTFAEEKGAVRLPSVGALRDHLAAGLVDVALLPLSTPGVAFSGPGIPLPPAEAWLLLGPPGDGAAPVLARPAADPGADAALRAAWRAAGVGGAPGLLALAPGAASANVLAGRLAAALLFGAAPPAPAGCRLLALGRDAALRPALGLARRAVGSREAGAAGARRLEDASLPGRTRVRGAPFAEA